MPFTAKQDECNEDTMFENECRQNNNIYKVVDFCLAAEEVGIKKELYKNGPVIA